MSMTDPAIKTRVDITKIRSCLFEKSSAGDVRMPVETRRSRPIDVKNDTEEAAKKAGIEKIIGTQKTAIETYDDPKAFITAVKEYASIKERNTISSGIRNAPKKENPSRIAAN
jgi:hypothetical protein